MFRFRPALTALLILSSPVWARRAAAQDESDVTGPVVARLEDRVTRFLDAISEGDQSEAFQELLQGSQLLEQKEAIQTLVDKSMQIEDRYGPLQESEPIGAKRVGKDVVLLKYLFKCEKFPVIWYFVFYRDFRGTATATDNEWVVIAVRFNTEFNELFD